MKTKGSTWYGDKDLIGEECTTGYSDTDLGDIIFEGGIGV